MSLQVATTSGYQPGEGTVYFGLLRDHSANGLEVWRCQHAHPKRPGARSCANGELRQRTPPTPPPEMRGNWPGMTQRVRDCLAPDGYREVPVCRMCARGLMHTQAEHQQLDPFAPQPPDQGAAT